MKHYTIDFKPEFEYGQIVKVDMECIGFPPEHRTGKIVGKSITELIDLWLVEFENDFGPIYPYKVISIPHTFILYP